MCSLSLHESSSGPVMTKRSGGTTLKLTRYLSQPPDLLHQPTSISHPQGGKFVYSSPSPPAPVAAPVLPCPRALPTDIQRSTAAARPRSGLQHRRSRSANWIHVLTQVGTLRVRCLLVLFLVVSLYLPPVMSKHWPTEHPKRITFKSRICRSVSQENLRNRMGASYDERQMAMDGTSAKRQFGDSRGYQGDDPYAGLDPDEMDLLDESLLSEEQMWLREEEIYTEDGVVKERIEEVKLGEDGEVDEEEVVEEVVEEGTENAFVGQSEEKSYGKRTWLPRRRFLGSNRRDEGRNFDAAELRFGKGGTTSVTSKPDYSNTYMRRRRRRRSAAPRPTPSPTSAPGADRQGVRLRAKNINQKNIDSDDEKARKRKNSNSISPKKSSDVNLALQLILSGKRRNNRKLRKQLKKEFRQRARKQNKPPPWQCNFRHRTVFMEKGVFPRVIRDGFCLTDKCFYRLYKCQPIKYAIKLLERDPQHCNPLPLEGNGTIYEERWNLKSQHITVGCNCASLAEGSRSKGRRKD